jgi:hypothetical protein
MNNGLETVESQLSTVDSKVESYPTTSPWSYDLFDEML